MGASKGLLKGDGYYLIEFQVRDEGGRPDSAEDVFKNLESCCNNSPGLSLLGYGLTEGEIDGFFLFHSSAVPDRVAEYFRTSMSSVIVARRPLATFAGITLYELSLSYRNPRQEVWDVYCRDLGVRTPWSLGQKPVGLI